MLADATRSEAYRFGKNRMAVFWSVAFVPLLFIVGGLIFHIVSKSRMSDLEGVAALPPGMAANAPIDLMDGLNFAFGAVANGGILVFMLIAAATLYAGDYRWETWRLISARNSRINLVLGKVAVFKLTALAATIAFLLSGLIYSVSEAVVYGRPLVVQGEGFELGRFLLVLGLGWVRIVQYAMIALLAAVVTRSLLAALFVPVVLGFAQGIIGGPGLVFLGWEPTQWQTQLLLPGLAYDTLKATIGGAPGQPDGVALKAGISLALWTLAPLLAALLWFQRQDLSKE